MSIPSGSVHPGFVRAALAGALTILVLVGVVSGEPAMSSVAAPAVPASRSGIGASCVSLADRMAIAVADAAAEGDVVGIAFIDRESGVYLGAGDSDVTFPAASVAKLFIADDYLYRNAAAAGPGGAVLGGVVTMLASSDDGPAELLWMSGGGPEVIARVAGRYALSATSAVGAWWDTAVTAADVARYYDGLLSGDGGLPESARRLMIAGLQASGPVAADGFEQDFGVWAMLERLGGPGIKQGWMATRDRTIRLSTGFAGLDH
ncbi:hypothetical protein [Rhodococcus sp. NPDC058514]|uniref:hypothetical protein n=1 Tax=Rhodococcus sp. NPDC058514 TaxID=3346532 RepID=UPI003648AC74